MPCKSVEWGVEAHRGDNNENRKNLLEILVTAENYPTLAGPSDPLPAAGLQDLISTVLSESPTPLAPRLPTPKVFPCWPLSPVLNGAGGRSRLSLRGESSRGKEIMKLFSATTGGSPGDSRS